MALFDYHIVKQKLRLWDNDRLKASKVVFKFISVVQERMKIKTKESYFPIQAIHPR